MDELDRRILEAVERGFPLDPEPYRRLAEEAGSDEETVFARVGAMLEDGTIRRLGASFDSRRLGRAATLAALRLPAARVAEVAALVNRYAEVTHNYERGDAWNLWFTVIARSEERVGEILEEIRREAGVAESDMMNLPARRTYKIDVRFSARQASGRDGGMRRGGAVGLVMALACGAALAAAGCGEGIASIRASHPQVGQAKVETRRTGYQFTQGRKIEMAAAKEWARPAGEAAPDFEYVYVIVPDTAGRYAIGEKGTAVYRLVGKDRHETLYRATSGSVTYRFAFLTKDHVHAEVDVTLEAVWPKAEAAGGFPMTGRISAKEDVKVCQGLINRYHGSVAALEEQSRAGAKAPEGK